MRVKLAKKIFRFAVAIRKPKIRSRIKPSYLESFDVGTEANPELLDIFVERSNVLLEYR